MHVDGMRFELDDCVICTDVSSNKTGGGEVAKKRGVPKKVGARIPRPPPLYKPVYGSHFFLA